MAEPAVTGLEAERDPPPCWGRGQPSRVATRGERVKGRGVISFRAAGWARGHVTPHVASGAREFSRVRRAAAKGDAGFECCRLW